MAIIETLKSKGIDVVPDGVFIGYERTDAGLNATHDPQKAEKRIDYLKPSMSKFVFPCNNDISYITTGSEYEGKVRSGEEVQKLAEQGLIYAISSTI